MPDNCPIGNIETDIKLLLSRLTIYEKFGQMVQLERSIDSIERLSDLVCFKAIGSMLSGGGSAPKPNTANSWADMVDSLQAAALRSRLKIPLLYANDSVHGQANLEGAVLFPHNIGLGCTGDPAIARRCAELTAIESRASGVHWIFAPCVSVPQDVRWGRTYEGFSDDCELVSRMGAAAVQGYQSHGTVACAKHWVGDGGTTFGTGEGTPRMLDRGDCRLPEGRLRKIHIRPYASCIRAGCQTVMVSFSSVNETKMHEHSHLLTTVLKEELGFDGILVSDWAGVDELAPWHQFRLALVRAITAGMDVVMLPGESWGCQGHASYFSAMDQAVKSGEIPLGRIDDAVARVLRVKIRMGLFQNPLPHRSDLKLVGCKEHREVARDAVRKSMVLLKNENEGLPLCKGSKVLLVGEAADDLGMQCGGWSIKLQGFAGNTATTGTTIMGGLQELGVDLMHRPSGRLVQMEGDVAVVVCGEKPYAETAGDRLEFGELFERQDRNLLLRLKRAKPTRKVVLVLISGRPLPLDEEVLEHVDSILVAWLPGTEGTGVADVLCGHTPTGKLSFNWPRAEGEGVAYRRGYGLTSW